MRDMLDGSEPLSADRLAQPVPAACARIWTTPSRAKRRWRRRAARRNKRSTWRDSLAQFWDALDRIFALAARR